MKKITLFLLFYCLISFFTSSFYVFADYIQDAERKARETYEMFKKTISSPRQVEQRYVNPLLGNVPIYTIDNSTSFNAQILCPSGSEFATVVIQPSSTGDLNVTVFHPGGQAFIQGISGICANGYIKCDPGTWNNCTYWQIKYSGNLYSVNATYSSLGGCFCVNNHCGSNLFWRNSGYILSVFGGIVGQALQEYDPSYTVSEAVIEGASIKLYGQSFSSCYQAGGSSQVKMLSSYMDTPLLISTRGFEVYESEVTNPESMAYAVTQATYNIGQFFEDRTCTRKRIINTRNYNFAEIFSGSTDCFGNIPGPYVCGEKCLYFEFGLVNTHGQGQALVNFEMTPDFYRALSEIKGSWRTDTHGPYPCLDDDGYVQFYLNNQYAGGESYGDSEAKCGCCSRAPTHWVTLNKNLINPPSGNASSMNTLKVLAGGAEHDTAEGACRPVRIYFFVSEPVRGCYVTNDYIEDNCNSLESDSECVLWEEKVDGVPTVQGGQKTGLVPRLKCETVCDKTVCDTGWLVERRYKCKTSDYNLTGIERRLETVTGTSTFDNTKITFEDIRLENGTWRQYSQQELYVRNFSQPDECEPVCRVTVSSAGREVEVNMSLRGETEARKEYLYKPCVLNNSNEYICPLSEGETLDVDCTCASFFNEAMMALQAIRLAGSDFICSSGVEKAF